MCWRMFKPSLHHSGVVEGPRVFGRESGLPKFDWVDHLHVSRQFCP